MLASATRHNCRPFRPRASMSLFVPGQRWISIAEPELGLGTAVKTEGRAVKVLYAAAGVIRQYAIQSAPLVRAQFKAGDRLHAGERELIVVSVEEREGLLVYHGESFSLPETELDDQQSFNTADARLMSGRADANGRFKLRLEALEWRSRMRQSPTYGFAGARVSLISHQMRVATATASRRPPRVLLADEVGLGKTIEACLAMARLISTGRVTRVLVLVPESLVHQWFVELLRRFNLAFAIYDEERCESLQLNEPERNPFSDEQLVLADMDFLAGSSKRAREALRAGWDLVVVDEAHHLEWSPEAASPQYQLVDALARSVEGLILLTATPEQLGRAGHFARLRLLDPARYPDLQRYLDEQAEYQDISELAGRLHDGDAVSEADLAELERRLGTEDAHIKAAMHELRDENPEARQALSAALVDRSGTGRVMFRNRRSNLGGFPERYPLLHRLECELSEALKAALSAEHQVDREAHPAGHTYDFSDDPRLHWLAAFLDRHQDDKVLLICRSSDKVLALEDALRTRTGALVARFHEHLSLVQRDRNGAFFADPEGAQLLLCSEIGSEGRNFQFAQHLVLFDLPVDPDLLEQRIGRLDRIGQRNDIHIHLPYIPGTAQEAVLRWYHEGLDAFRAPVADGRQLLRLHGERLHEIAHRHAIDPVEASQDLEVLIAETRVDHQNFADALARGRDRLLELSSQRAGEGDAVLQAIAEQDADLGLDDFTLRLFEQFGVEYELQHGRSYLLNPEYLSTSDFPGLKDGQQCVTFDRDEALQREDLPFLRAEHPMLEGALALLLESELGTSAFLIDATLPPRTALLEAVFVLECVGDQELFPDRFLPATPLRVTIDSRLNERADFRADPGSELRAGDSPVDLSRYQKVLRALVPPMLEKATALIESRSTQRISEAREAMQDALDLEIERLEALRRVNPAVREDEIEAARAERDLLDDDLAASRLRLDSVRFVASRDFLALR